MTLNERLYAFIDHLGITVAAFERNCNFSNGFVKNVGEQVGASKLAQILGAYPELSPTWLIMGIGDMLNNSDNSNLQPGKFSNNRRSFNNFQYSSEASLQILASELNKKNEQIDRMIDLLEYIVYQNGKGDFIPYKSLPESRQKSSK